jgi:hypothetical protein
MSPGAYDVFWKAMSPEIITHPGDLLVHYANSEEIKLLMQKKHSCNFIVIYPSNRPTQRGLLGI